MTKAQLDAIIAKLAQAFPDSDALMSVECFADWLTKYQREVEVDRQLAKPMRYLTLAGIEQPRSYQLPAIKMAEERAKELLQQYRDTFPDTLHPGGFPNFPCVAIDLASGVDYSVEQHPIQADHASVDDQGNVSVSVGYRLTEAPRRVGKDPALAAPYGKPWSQFTADDIYKDISGMLLRQQADEEYNRRAVENGLQQEWVHLLDGRVSSYVPAYQAGDAVFSTGRFEDGHMFVETMDKGEKAVTLARAYLLRLVNLELKS